MQYLDSLIVNIAKKIFLSWIDNIAKIIITEHFANKSQFIIYYLSKIYFSSAITCDTPPTITGGSTDCPASTAFDGTCIASCSSGFHMDGTATLTCQDSDNDGTGDFSTAPTCTGILF